MDVDDVEIPPPIKGRKSSNIAMEDDNALIASPDAELADSQFSGEHNIEEFSNSVDTSQQQETVLEESNAEDSSNEQIPPTPEKPDGETINISFRSSNILNLDDESTSKRLISFEETEGEDVEHAMESLHGEEGHWIGETKELDSPSIPLGEENISPSEPVVEQNGPPEENSKRIEDPPFLKPPLQEQKETFTVPESVSSVPKHKGNASVLRRNKPPALKPYASDWKKDKSKTSMVQLKQMKMKRRQSIHILSRRKQFDLDPTPIGLEDSLLGFDEDNGEAKWGTNFQSFIKSNSRVRKISHRDDSSFESGQQAKKIKLSTNQRSSSEMDKSSSIVSPSKVVESNTKVNSWNKQKSNKSQSKSENNSQTINGTDIDSFTKTQTNVYNSNTPTSSGAASSQWQKKSNITPQDDFYKKPFQFGWKRELVWRANLEASKDKADVYFIAPNGKKLRTRNEILPLLDGNLTIDHFCFIREPTGAGPDFETVRSAKPSSRISVTAATLAAAPTAMGKRISKPKVPKGASPPPEGWTATQAIKANNALLSSKASSSHQFVSASTNMSPNARLSTSTSSVNRNTRAKKNLTSTQSNTSTPTQKPCSVKCSRAYGLVPQLQCIKCVCLFHHECVGLNRYNCEYRVWTGDGRTPGSLHGKEYVCKTCLPLTEKTSTPVAARPGPASAKLAQPAGFSGKNLSVRLERIENKFPQTIAVVKGKKYVMVTRPMPTAIAPQNFEKDFKQISENVRKVRKAPTPTTSLLSQSQNQSQSQTQFANNFFSNVSHAYSTLIDVLQYLKIHERSRAASVCKFWYLAAKDNVLWKTLRMKNSKVCDWAGFTAAMRRGETKHLDLRKMLLPSHRMDEMWQQFSEFIGTVFSLENIEMCRCSARTVESLFQTNKNLRILNAVAINDGIINLTNIDAMRNLRELRLRTCENGVLAHDLQPLQSLRNLQHLSLTAIEGLGTKSIEVIAELTELLSLELGECGHFDSTFAEVVLPRLKRLHRLRLENGQKSSCSTIELLESIVPLEKLSQLELINFDIKDGFDEKLRECVHLRKLMIIPTYILQSATTNQIMLRAVQLVANTLKIFTWGVTVELLRVTALYVDQCEESAKKEKHHFDECIPVLKPVPGESTSVISRSLTNADESGQDMDNSDANPNGEPEIEILPLEKVKTILTENLPHTKFSIVKVPYHTAWKQQLVE